MTQRLAQAMSYELFVGNTLYMKRLLDYERTVQGALSIGVADGRGRWEAISGDGGALPVLGYKPESRARREGHLWLFLEEVRSPTADSDDPYLATSPEQSIGWVAVVLDDTSLHQARAEIVLASAGIMSLLLVLAGGIAWRLSSRLGGRLRGLAQTVERIADGDLGARVREVATGELGVLENGVNRMAQTLEENRRDLEQRIRDATAGLRQQTHAAEAAVLAKSKFLAAASHDLRQPLHAMTLLIAAMKERISDVEARRLAEHVESSAEAMQNLLNALLDLSRLDAGAVAVKPECFRVSGLLRRLEHRFAPMAAEKGLHLRVVPTRMAVHSDPVLLERILGNLIANAIRYTDRGGVVVGVRRGQAEAMRFEVWDSGRGVPEHFQKRIFEEYFQLDNPERDRDKGLGLGLAIVERLSGLLDCPVKMRSIPGRGSCFSICAQRCAEDGLAQETEATQPGRLAPENAMVAFIDDDEGILEAMLELFDSWQIDLAVGTEAEEVAADLRDMRREPALILCDYRLREGRTGIDAIRLLREQFGEHIPAMLITGDTAPETLKCIQESGLPVLHKPLKPAKLRAILSYTLAGEGQAPEGGGEAAAD